MHRRLERFERRLARVAAVVRGWSAAAAYQRTVRNTRRGVAALIRAGLERAGLDPAQAVALRRCETPEPPVPPPLPRTDPRGEFVTRMRALAERMRGEPPALASASAVELLAYYCFGNDTGAPG